MPPPPLSRGPLLNGTCARYRHLRAPLVPPTDQAVAQPHSVPSPYDKGLFGIVSERGYNARQRAQEGNRFLDGCAVLGGELVAVFDNQVEPKLCVVRTTDVHPRLA